MAHYFRDAGWLLRSSGYEMLQGGSKRFKPRIELVAVKASLKHVLAFYNGGANAIRREAGTKGRWYPAQTLAEKESMIAEKLAMVAAKDAMIARLETMLAQKDEMASLRAVAHGYVLAEARRQ
ncbi:hypothetical protein BDZ88DRAFT_450771 [Geranomyces variabilis]|nr:hypothetical protein BDZ88DRAFT_450771 [Geranomyces variabilis]KAJ3134816.1 hypothetical protein HDU90_004847 [Geranomyces variabilis]